MFDIILPTIGRSTAKDAIESVINQTYPHWHLYVLHDINRPALSELLLDERITMVGTDDTGYSGSSLRHRAIEIATQAKWIAYIDDDDTWLPHHLETINKHLTRNPDVTMVHTLGQMFKRRKHRGPKLFSGAYHEPMTVGQAHTRELYMKTRGWQPCDNHDHILWHDMIAAGGVASVIENVTFHFDRSKR